MQQMKVVDFKPISTGHIFTKQLNNTNSIPKNELLKKAKYIFYGFHALGCSGSSSSHSLNSN